MSLLDRAYAQLEITEAAVESLPKIRHLCKPVGNCAAILDYLSHSEEPEAVAVCQKAKAVPRTTLAVVPIEALCAAAGVSPKKLFGIIAQEVSDQSAKATALMSKAMHPRVLEATIDAALLPDGTADRKIIHQAEQYLPVPKTSVTFAKHIDARTQTQNVAILRPLEDSMKRLSDRFLEIAPPAPVIQEENENEE
jgi:hypothetical protein